MVARRRSVIAMLTVLRHTGTIPTMPDDVPYSLTELADVAGVTPRTVRYYLSQGLLPGVGQTGPGSKYGSAHLARLRLIRRLQAEHLPLAEIRRRLDDLDDDEIGELSGSDAPAPPSDSALDYLRSVLDARPARPVAMPKPGIRTPPPPRLQSQVGSLRDADVPAHGTVAGRLAEPYPSTPAPAATATSAAPFDRSQWERIVLAPDVELHIRRPLSRAQNKQVDRLITIARELLEEDRS